MWICCSDHCLCSPVSECFISSVQSLSLVWLFETPWTAACQAFLSIELVMPSNHLIFYRPLLLLPSVLPSIRVFSSESVLHIMWPKYLSFSFSISPSKEYSGPISCRINWFDLLEVRDCHLDLLSESERHCHVWLFATPWTSAHQASLSITNSSSLLKLMSIELVMPSNHFILCRPLLLLPAIPPSITVFSNESTLHEVTKVLEFQL